MVDTTPYTKLLVKNTINIDIEFCILRNFEQVLNILTRFWYQGTDTNEKYILPYNKANVCVQDMNIL